MKNFFTSILLILVIGYTLQAEASHPFEGGAGTSENPYQIKTAVQLDAIRGEYLDKYFEQVADIDLAGLYWEPIGGNNTEDRFTGHYNGGVYKIYNLTVFLPSSSNVGLFGHVGQNGNGATTISNVQLIGVSVLGGRGTGSLIGRVTGNQNTRVENCYATNGTVSGYGATGGLVGSNNSYMTNAAAAESFRPVIYKCWANIDVSLREGAEGNKDKFGGLTGCNQKGLISNCYARGSVNVEGGTRVGGLAGCVELRGVILNSYSTGEVSGTGASNIGGFLGMVGMGRNEGIANQCYWDTETSFQASSAAGTGKNTTEMKTVGTFESWDFETIWEINTENDSYPSLREMYNPSSIWVWQTNNTTEWNDQANWNQPTSPGPLSVVEIPGGGIQPVLTGNEGIFALILHNGAEVTIENTYSLSVTESFTILESGNASITGGGELLLDGDYSQEIPSMAFNNLTINNHNNVKLAGDITVYGVLEMENGFLDLNGHNITLGPDAHLLEGEFTNYSSRIYGKSGSIQTTRTLDMPQGEDIAGMGIRITTSKNLGVTTIQRGHNSLEGGNDSKSILRWFDIRPTSPDEDLDATLVFHYFFSELNLPAEDESSSFSLFKSSNGSDWNIISSVLDTENNTLTAENISGFSIWTASSTNKPLPIALLSFDVVADNNEVALKWTTASEINNDFFTIERSADGRNFEPVGFVQGAGNSNKVLNYHKRDIQPLEGISYYRLKQTDYDGSYEYSYIVSVKMDNRTNVSDILLYPNPNNGRFNIQHAGESNLLFKIYDMHGRMVYASEAAPLNVTQISETNLKTGLYSVVFEGAEIFTRKMMVR